MKRRKKKERHNSQMGKHAEEPEVRDVGAEGIEMSGGLGGQGRAGDHGEAVV